jgi:hypothetical protein
VTSGAAPGWWDERATAPVAKALVADSGTAAPSLVGAMPMMKTLEIRTPDRLL